MPSPIFKDKGKWYFWDETWTQFLGPFPDKDYAEQGLQEYSNYLATGQHTGFLTGTKWFDGERRRIDQLDEES